jgi:hypothetical protein
MIARWRKVINNIGIDNLSFICYLVILFITFLRMTCIIKYFVYRFCIFVIQITIFCVAIKTKES